MRENQDPTEAAAHAGGELARGALVSALTLAVTNLRGIFTFLVARLLGSGPLGTYALAFNIMDLASKVGTFGMDSGSTTLVARAEARGDHSESRAVFRRALAVGLLLSALVALLGWLLYPGLGRRLGQPAALAHAVSLMLLAIPAVTLYRISNGVSRGLKRVGHELYSRGLAESLVTLLAFFVAWRATASPLAPIVAVLLGTAAQGAVAFRLASRAIALLPPSPVPEGAGQPGIVRFSAPIAGYNLLNVLVERLDVMLLSAFIGRAPGLTVETFGVYCLAGEVAGSLRKVRQTFDPIFAPVIAGQSVDIERERMRESIAQVSRWVAAAVLPLVGLLALAGGAVLSLYGRSFAAGAAWLLVLAIGHGTGAFVGLAETVLGVERPWINLVNSALGVLALGLLSLALVPRFGALGAALAVALTYGLQGSLRYLELFFAFGRRWPWGACARPLAGFVLAMAPAVATRVLLAGLAGQLAAALVFALAYAGAWSWMGLDPRDRATLERLGWLRRRLPR